MDFERGQDPIKAMGLGAFIYDNGFGPKHYVCTNCKSVRLLQKHRGGFQPPYYICQDCGEEVHAPAWIDLDPNGNPLTEIRSKKVKR